DLEHETSQGSQRRQITEHLAEPVSLSAIEVLGPSDDQMPLLPDEVGLFFLGFAIAFPGALLGLAQPTAPAFAFSLLGQSFAQAAQGIEDMVVDVLDDMENAQLVSCLGPDRRQHFRIQVRAVADHDLWGKSPVLEIVQEAAHVLLIV